MNETLEVVKDEVVEPEPETGDVTEEPEQPAPAPAPEPEEPEGQTPPEQQVDPVAMEKTLKKVDQAGTTYRNRVSDLLGDAILGFSPCPLCSDGVMGHIPPLEDAVPSSELQARLLEVLKQPNEPAYQDAPNARRCGTCDGWGKVKSGSRVAGKTLVKCPTCNENGYQGGGAPAHAPNAGNGTVELATPEEPTFTVTDDVDIWGSPRLLDDGQENPNYGKMVQYKNPELP